MPGAELWIPPKPTLPVLRQAVQLCEGCDLHRYATQAVFGEGPRKARIFMIGEQPGNEEDLQGHPFVGPSGRILDRALTDSSIDRTEVYVTNAVKHFKFEERGKRRLHKKPLSTEIRACRPWLEAEVKLVGPKVIVCLGATAAQTVLGNAFRVTQQRGVPLEHPWASYVLATIHPSAILRVPDKQGREAEYSRFVDDLKNAATFL
ncbi:MAG TPA: UdgX family uracil-DNA binding protein [Bryobacteraceae bacterium]|jgi:DNA polymerase